MNYHITIDGDISRWGFSKQFLRESLAPFKDKHVDMRLSSLGGDLNHGLEMRQQLIDHGDVTVYLYGFVASAATVIAMGAKHIAMSKYAMFLVHKCSNFVDAWGNYNADELQQLIDDLEANKRVNDKLDVVLAQLYAKRCNKQVSDILDVLKKADWLTAQEALDYGFIDEIIDDDEDAKINFSPELQAKFNAYNLPVARFADSPGNSSQSMLAQILDAIRSMFRAQAQSPLKENQKSNSKMLEIAIYPAVMNAMGVDKLAFAEDGNVALSQAQLDAINSAIDKANADIADRDAKIAQLTEQIENLKNLPADDTADVKEDTAQYMSSEEMYNLLKQF